MQMEKETKKHFPPGQVITYINMLKKTLKIGMVFLRRLIIIIMTVEKRHAQVEIEKALDQTGKLNSASGSH